MNTLDELDRQLMINLIIDLDDEEKRTPAFYNTVNSILERHKFRLELLEKRAAGVEYVSLDREELEDMDIIQLLEMLDANVYMMVVYDLKMPINRKPTFYSAVNKLLARHLVSIATINPNEDIIPENLTKALETYKLYAESEIPIQ